MTRDGADWQKPTSKQMDANYTVNSQTNLRTHRGNFQSWLLSNPESNSTIHQFTNNIPMHQFDQIAKVLNYRPPVATFKLCS